MTFPSFVVRLDSTVMGAGRRVESASEGAAGDFAGPRNWAMWLNPCLSVLMRSLGRDQLTSYSLPEPSSLDTKTSRSVYSATLLTLGAGLLRSISEVDLVGEVRLSS